MFRGSKLQLTTSSFDDASVFERHCRGQGPRYNHSSGALVYGVDCDSDTPHFNFSGFFVGMCCFCASHTGFGSELFLSSGCSNCVRKDILLSAAARLFAKRGDSVDPSWGSHGWRALPVALVDCILAFVAGIHGAEERIAVYDGKIVLRNA